MTAPLSNFLIPVKAIQVQKVSLSDIQISGLFVNPFTADNNYSPAKRCNLFQHFQMQLCHFVNLDSILKIFKKTMILIADVYLTLRTPKHVVQ